MATVNIKGKPKGKDKKFVRIELVIYVPGYPRVPKVIKPITGFYSEWDNVNNRFFENSSRNIEKNQRLYEIKKQYLELIEKWETEGEIFSPVQLSHYFDKPKEEKQNLPKVYKVHEVNKMKIDYLSTKEVIKNKEIISGNKGSANMYVKLRNSIQRFTLEKYNKNFTNYYFEDITENFVLDYIFYLQKEGIKNGNNACLRHKLKALRAIVNYANKLKIPGVKREFFYKNEYIRSKMTKKDFTPRSQPSSFFSRIEKMDKSKFTPKELLYIDLFLFSYYAGGIGNTDICFLTHDNIKNGILEYERNKTAKKACVPLIGKAIRIIDKYKNISLGNYVFPIFNEKHDTSTLKKNRVDYITTKVNKLLKKITKILEYPENVTWYSARGSYITKMCDMGVNPFIVAQHAGNSIKTIQMHYYKDVNPEEIIKKMEESL